MGGHEFLAKNPPYSRKMEEVWGVQICGLPSPLSAFCSLTDLNPFTPTTNQLTYLLSPFFWEICELLFLCSVFCYHFHFPFYFSFCHNLPVSFLFSFPKVCPLSLNRSWLLTWLPTLLQTVQSLTTTYLHPFFLTFLSFLDFCLHFHFPLSALCFLANTHAPSVSSLFTYPSKLIQWAHHFLTHCILVQKVVFNASKSGCMCLCIYEWQEHWISGPECTFVCCGVVVGGCSKGSPHVGKWTGLSHKPEGGTVRLKDCYQIYRRYTATNTDGNNQHLVRWKETKKMLGVLGGLPTPVNNWLFLLRTLSLVKDFPQLDGWSLREKWSWAKVHQLHQAV